MNPKHIVTGILATGILVLAATLAMATAQRAEGRGEEAAVTSLFRVEGMTCGGCEMAVKNVVKKLDGVEKVDASHRESQATVTYDSAKVTPAQIVAAIEKLGYTAERLREDAREQRPDAELKAERQAELIDEPRGT